MMIEKRIPGHSVLMRPPLLKSQLPKDPEAGILTVLQRLGPSPTMDLKLLVNRFKSSTWKKLVKEGRIVILQEPHPGPRIFGLPGDEWMWGAN